VTIMTEKLLRSFVAVPLPGTVQQEIALAARQVARELPDANVKWSRKTENLHMTLKVLGPVAEGRLAEVGAELSEKLAGVPRFDFKVRGFGAFPTAERANVLYAGVDEPGARGLADVAEIVEAVTARFGFLREARVFTGHVTIGRSRSKEGVDARAALTPWGERAFGAVMVEDVHVYESRLGRPGDAGSTYVLRSRAALRAN
jgi:2'-5' RNA ligase